MGEGDLSFGPRAPSAEEGEARQTMRIYGLKTNGRLTAPKSGSTVQFTGDEYRSNQRFFCGIS